MLLDKLSLHKPWIYKQNKRKCSWDFINSYSRMRKRTWWWNEVKIEAMDFNHFPRQNLSSLSTSAAERVSFFTLFYILKSHRHFVHSDCIYLMPNICRAPYQVLERLLILWHVPLSSRNLTFSSRRKYTCLLLVS